MSTLTNSPVWRKLQKQSQQISNLQIRELFNQDEKRYQKFSAEGAGLFLDYSKNLITTETISLLIQLAVDAKLKEHIAQMFAGDPINNTEKRSVLHTALRDLNSDSHLFVDNVDITQLVKNSLTKMEACVRAIHDGSWVGYSGKRITDVVNIGIGGSDLGPAMVTKALLPYGKNDLRCHFVSNVDGAAISEILKDLNPETTLFIVASKTFTTQETLCNARTAKKWLLDKAKSNEDVTRYHFVAVTAKSDRAIEFGINADNIYPFWDWVGGRYSLWSAIGLSIVLSIGMENFISLLKGAEMMDKHFRETPWQNNLPVILALLGIWHINFLNADTQAIIPYAESLNLFPAYLQQLDMESNGKSVCKDGTAIDYATAPIIWGTVGTNGQHAYHQLLMQGTELVPIDFILPLNSQYPIGDHNMLLVANCFAQAQALMQGKSRDEIRKELLADGLTEEEANKLIPHKVIFGNRPSNMILMPKLTPETLGAMIAMYEHKVFAQGVIWRINSFDQWGVELGKKLTSKITPVLQGKESDATLDPSTRNLINLYLKGKR